MDDDQITKQRESDQGDDLVGTYVGGYKLVELLGRGGSGAVYLAADLNGRPVAIKLLGMSVGVDATLRRRFAREARVARSLQHPRLVPVLDAGDDDGQLYLVQRFMPGGSLLGVIEREGCLSPARTAVICEQVAEGLDALLAAAIVHRDVKPANILLDAQACAHISDLGLVKDRNATNLTRPGRQLGSLRYMAPEQIRGEAVSAATDVYGLACVAFHCLTGHPLWHKVEGMQLMWCALEETPPDPATESGEISAAFAATLLGALAKDPVRRPQTPGEFALALRRSL